MGLVGLGGAGISVVLNIFDAMDLCEFLGEGA